ncbi:response regulator transcription factor [Rhizobium sp. SGZ-381]|uniref:response regulator transcription factor n=1 Tax=Rhizobium sp. SGZ-381 TaxID=3342800 RepID=UPI00366FDCF1
MIGIVDDDPDIPAALASLIRSLGYMAVCFSSAEALLSSDDIGRLSCVISDIHMPMMSGLDLVPLLKKLRPSLPVILMTGRFEQGLAERAVAAGAAVLVTKPFGLDDLLETISRSVRG